MSKFAKMLRLIDTGQRKALPEKMGTIEDLMTTSLDIDDVFLNEGRMYSAEVRLHDNVMIPTDLPHECHDMTIDNIKRRFVEAMFGEFREDILLLRQQIYSYDVDGANNTLSRIEKNMFEV